MLLTPVTYNNVSQTIPVNRNYETASDLPCHCIRAVGYRHSPRISGSKRKSMNVCTMGKPDCTVFHMWYLKHSKAGNELF